MARQRPAPELPPCYAIVQPGLEEIAGEEIAQRLGGEVKKTMRGLLVFRVPELTPELLELRTTEDVFLLGWGTDQLTYRAEDLERIRRWTSHEVRWDQLLRLHHGIHPKPKGKPTYHLVTQMTGKHGYLRRDARKALAQGLAGKFPESWRPAEENAAIEVWLTIDGPSAVCGLRLSDRTMRHRTYKAEHLPASLRPTVAAALVHLADIRSGQVVVDPMCGAGTIVAEVLDAHRAERGLTVLGGDRERAAVRAASANLRRLNPALLACWDATRLPLADLSIDRLVSNPPFGKQLSNPEEIGPLYRCMIPEYDRVLKRGGIAVLLVSEAAVLKEAARAAGWKLLRQVPMQVLGQRALISVWRKPF